ncbi:hypothetical protein [Flavobacterium sp.]|uniref:hypothetical protein n=1 Tax=Flavobacterium sp. TaxID=239 RepID=UPI002B4AE77B|nr:hypothetical protein [Flavobacterium sp.]HLF51523.1 hypothetical protein [Flavobacterium sp.]
MNPLAEFIDEMVNITTLTKSAWINQLSDDDLKWLFREFSVLNDLAKDEQFSREIKYEED